ncbi:hypothetical protein HK102_010752, partial [Quaeritorhiza haematococci]
GDEHKQKFLNVYSDMELWNGVAKTGVVEMLAEKGYRDLVLMSDTRDHFVHRLTLTDSTLLTPQQLKGEVKTDPAGHKVCIFNIKESNFLIDLFMRRKDINAYDLKGYQEMLKAEIRENENSPASSPVSPTAPVSITVEPAPAESESSPPESPIEPMAKPTTFTLDAQDSAMVRQFLDRTFPSNLAVSVMEWMCMQNPKAPFPPHRPQCPGQRHPGLGVAQAFFQGILMLATSKRRDGLLTIPEKAHLGFEYQHRGYIFINPAFQGYVLALEHDLKHDLETYGLAAVSWAFERGYVTTKEGIIEMWNPQDMLYPISKRSHTYFQNPEYNRLVQYFRQKFCNRVYIDWVKAKDCLEYALPA